MKHPNIVIILADDMGFGDVTCYNPDSRIPTPHMDSLAGQGVRFTDMHSPSAVCTPTRYGLLTGRYAWRSNLKSGVLYGYEPALIEKGRLTLPEMLRAQGYDTACIGKWHLGLQYTAKQGMTVDFDAPLPWESVDADIEQKIDLTAPLAEGPTTRGFDYFFGTSGCSTAQPPYAFIENDRFVETPSEYREKIDLTGRPGMTAPSWDHRDADPTFTRKAVEYIESMRDNEHPFFLYLAASAPHEPCLKATVPDFALGKSDAGSRGDLVWLFDWMVGQVTDALDRCGLRDDTLVIVTSDNGALPGDRVRAIPGIEAYDMYGHKSCGDWRGYKAHIWEGGHREPFIANWPGVITGGETRDGLYCMTDIMATCAAVADADLPSDAAEDSLNIIEAISTTAAKGSSPVTGHNRRDGVVHHSHLGVFSARVGDWKLIAESKTSGGWPPPRGEAPVPGGPGQLYNLREDPYETHDLFDVKPDVVAELMDLLDTYQKTGGSVE